jgi:type VI secretion system protein ImpC
MPNPPNTPNGSTPPEPAPQPAPLAPAADKDKLTLTGFLESVRLSELPKPARPLLAGTPTKGDLAVVDPTGDPAQAVPITPEERFIASMAAVLFNMGQDAGRFDKQNIQDLVRTIDTLVDAQLNEVLHHKDFQEMEANWRSLEDLVQNTNFKAGIQLSLLDITKEEAFEDLSMNAADISGSELFKKLYVTDYDQYGGTPYGAVIGLYEFGDGKRSLDDELLWLKAMGKVSTASHAPFIASVAPQFFKGCQTMRDVAQLRDISGLLEMPIYSAWSKLRDSEEAAYIGLTMPRHIVRPPYNDTTHRAAGIHFTEKIRNGVGTDADGNPLDPDADYLWGNSAMLFARNLVRSFETSGWCQHIRGPKGGGLVSGLPAHSFNVRGEDELKLPVESTIPDFREYELARAGFIPLVQKKGSADAVFFSAQSIKKVRGPFKDPKDSENAQLVTNLAYTFSISRIAHHLKGIMRENIGSTANAQYIFTQIDRWISGFVTALANPDDLTLRYYPFKAYSLSVEEEPGKVGWYKCNLAIVPHIQFEGMNVDLRVDARLGK